MKYFFLMLLSVAAIAAKANEIEGVYNGSTPSRHYGKVKIQKRGQGYTLTTCGSYHAGNGLACLPIFASLQENSPGVYRSLSGSITAYYSGQPCSYPISMQIRTENGAIYLSENGPGNFPASSGCPSKDRLNYSDFSEPDAYLRIAK